MSPTTAPLIDPARWIKQPVWRGLYRLAAPVLERVLGIRDFNACHARMPETFERDNFFVEALRVVDLRYVITPEDRARVPRQGPLLVVGNHPHGAADGIILGALLATVRPDVKVLGNFLLNQMPGMRPWNIAVDPFGGAGAARSNLGPLRECLKWLKGGGALAAFPAGTVSHYHWRAGQVTDPEWSDNLAALARKTGATVLPVFLSGCNSPLFQAIGLIHPFLRTALLLREVMRIRGSTIEVRIGKPVPASRLGEFDSDREATEYFRLKTYILGRRQAEPRKKVLFLPRFPRRTPPQEPVISPTPRADLMAEIASLPAEAQFVRHEEYSVYCARAHQVPSVLRELGRLREITFREVGEGTGRPFDTDRFDDHYHHLFLWSHADQDLVGAYRLGPTDEILNLYGPDGLYTTTLFKYKPGLLDRLNPALELGRSFIQSAYQRRHTSLSLLWRGIGEFIVRQPRYRILFGPVSISAEYQSLSKTLIVQYLRRNRLNPEFAPLVKARKPPRARGWEGLDRHALFAAARDIEDISALVSEIESDQKGVPVLLRQYIKLNAKFLSFNVDTEFSDVIDGLVLVDLCRADPKVLRRYLGEEGCARFCDYYRDDPEFATTAATQGTEGDEP